MLLFVADFMFFLVKLLHIILLDTSNTDCSTIEFSSQCLRTCIDFVLYSPAEIHQVRMEVTFLRSLRANKRWPNEYLFLFIQPLWSWSLAPHPVQIRMIAAFNQRCGSLMSSPDCVVLLRRYTWHFVRSSGEEQFTKEKVRWISSLLQVICISRVCVLCTRMQNINPECS